MYARKRNLAIWALFWLAVVLQSNQLPAQNWLSRDQTGKVFQGLNELALIRDEVLDRYVSFCVRENVKVRPNTPPTLTPSYILNAVSKSDGVDYTARVTFVMAGVGNAPFDSQHWVECLRCKHAYRTFGGIINPFPRRWSASMEGQTEEDYERAHEASQPMYFDSCDDIFILTRAYDENRRDRNAMEILFFQQAEFVSSRYIVHGDVESLWRYKRGDLDCEIKLVQSAASKYLPSEIHRFNAKLPLKNYFCRTRLDWQQYKDKKTWLPHHIHAAEVGGFGKQNTLFEYHNQIHWLVGDDATDDFFQCESPNFRIPITEAFEKEYDYFDGSRLIRAPRYERPDDFFLDASLNRK